MPLPSWAKGFTQLLKELFNGKAIRELRFHALIAPLICILFTVITFLIYVAIIPFTPYKVNFPLPLLVFLSGSLGGVISNYQRISKIYENEVQENTISLTEHQSLIAIAQIYVTPLIGGIFGILLYAIFLTGIIQHITFDLALLPKITTSVDNDFKGIVKLFNSTGPARNKDAILIIIWAFVAGFSEKMVPNFLDKLADQLKTKSIEKKPNQKGA